MKTKDKCLEALRFEWQTARQIAEEANVTRLQASCSLKRLVNIGYRPRDGVMIEYETMRCGQNNAVTGFYRLTRDVRHDPLVLFMEGARKAA